MANLQTGNVVDTAVVVPASIRAGAARADELLALAQAEARGEAPPTTQAPPPVPQPDGKDALPTPVPQPPQEQPATPPAPPPQAPEQPQAPQQLTAAEWEQRYRAMKGRYDAAEQRAQAMQADFQRQLDELRRAPPAQPVPPVDLTTFDAEDDATWGPDFRNAVQRRVDAAAAQLRQELAGRVQQTEATINASREDLMKQELTRALPGGNGALGWEDINFEPAFIDWLQLTDAFSGVKRHDLLKRAWAACDTQRVLLFFNRFLSEAAPAPAVGQAPAPLPAPNGDIPPASQRLSLTELAAPGPARPAASANSPATPTVKRFWKNSEIGEFFRAKHRGAYDGTPENRALAAAYEADIFAAQAEGRVSPG